MATPWLSASQGLPEVFPSSPQVGSYCKVHTRPRSALGLIKVYGCICVHSCLAAYADPKCFQYWPKPTLSTHARSRSHCSCPCWSADRQPTHSVQNCPCHPSLQWHWPNTHCPCPEQTWSPPEGMHKSCDIPAGGPKISSTISPSTLST